LSLGKEDPALTKMKVHGKEKAKTSYNIFLNWITNVTFGTRLKINSSFLFVVLSVYFLHFIGQGNDMSPLCFLLIPLCVQSQFILLHVGQQ